MRNRVLLPLLAAALVPCGSIAYAQESIGLPAAASAFIASASALAKSASDEVQLDRSQARLTEIRTALTKKLLSIDTLKPISLMDVLDEKKLLCGPRESHITYIARYNYLNALVARINEVSKPKPATDLGSALALFLADYTVDAGQAALGDPTLHKLQARDKRRCENDIKSFDLAYYGAPILSPGGRPPAAPSAAAAVSFGFLGPIGAVIDTFISVFTPVVVGAANLVDEAKRRDAIVTFLADPDHQKEIKVVGKYLAGELSDYTWSKRRVLAASFVEQQFELRNTTVDLSKVDACKDLIANRFKRSDSGAPSSTFMLCWRAAWGKLQGQVATLLKTGDDYDRLADAGDTASALQAYNEITQDLSAIKENSVTSPKVLWEQVLKLVSFAKTVSAAFSEENRAKIHKAIDDLVKA